MLFRRVVPLCCAFVIAATAWGQIHTVTRVGLVVKPKTYRGPCPATMHFIATIHVSHHPAVVEYQWERSDGATGPRQRVTINSAGQGVQDTWTLGAQGARADVWERLHVLAPTGIESPMVYAHVKCR